MRNDVMNKSSYLHQLVCDKSSPSSNNALHLEGIFCKAIDFSKHGIPPEVKDVKIIEK